MKEICINLDEYNRDSINTIQGNNNAEVYKIYVLFNKRRIDLTGKTVKMAYLRTGTVEGDVINLNVTNATKGEITLQITNAISKRDGVYSCQLAICGADEFLEHTATFGLTVEANIFNQIANEIANSKDLTYIERMLEEAKTVSRDLKTNIPVATNLNISLESNISDARNINTTLADTAEKSKVAANDAMEKKSQLENSITKAKEFIDGLDGSQDIPGMRMELTELQNGLKSNQALSYEGSSIATENTLEGRTEGMVVKGRTLQNIVTKVNKGFNDEDIDNYVFKQISVFDICSIHLKPNTTYTLFLNIIEMTDKSYFAINSEVYSAINGSYPQKSIGIKKIVMTTKSTIPNSNSVGSDNMPAIRCYGNPPEGGIIKISKKIMLLEGDWSNKEIPPYFEGIKSFGESEREDDKYKISILSHNYNLYDLEKAKKISADNVTFNKDGSVEFYQGGERFIIENDFIPNTQYTVTFTGISGQCKFNFHYTDGSDEPFGFLGEVTATSNINKTLKEIRSSWTTVEKSTVNKIQVIKGNQKLPYISPKQNKKDILIKEPLRSVGDVCDVLYEDNGQVKVYRKLGKYTFTGDENFVQLNNDNNSLSVYVDMNNSLSILLNGIAICNNFNYLAPNDLVTKYLEGISISGSAKNRFLFKISTSKLSTPNIEGFKAWLKANPTEIIYPITTPTTEIVENCVDIDLDTYQEKTYFNILNSLPGTLDFKVPSNIGSLVQSNAKEINNINEFINNFILKALLEMNKDLAAIKIKNGLN